MSIAKAVSRGAIQALIAAAGLFIGLTLYEKFSGKSL